MCKSPYAAHWKYRSKHCPNLVADEADLIKFPEINRTFPLKVIFDKNQTMHWDSLVHLWSNWYDLYLKATYPRLIVRFEDMLIHGPTIMKNIADCAGVTTPDVFQYQTGSAKGHGSGTTFLKALEKTGDPIKRKARMTKDDLEYAKEHLDSNLMKVFQYSHPEVEFTKNKTAAR
jgi:hypothetical protein